MQLYALLVNEKNVQLSNIVPFQTTLDHGDLVNGSDIRLSLKDNGFEELMIAVIAEPLGNPPVAVFSFDFSNEQKDAFRHEGPSVGEEVTFASGMLRLGHGGQ